MYAIKNQIGTLTGGKDHILSGGDSEQLNEVNLKHLQQ